MKRAVSSVATLLGVIVLVLLLVDPTRPLLPVFVLLGMGAGCIVLAWFLPRSITPAAICVHFDNSVFRD
jgi:hypothetical protein